MSDGIGLGNFLLEIKLGIHIFLFKLPIPIMEHLPINTFFDSVARHNLERFHSECLAWLFNTEHQIANQVIQKITSESGVEFIYAFTEVQQLDLVLYYRYQEIEKALIIENKVKAAEGSKKLTKQEKDVWKTDFEEGHTFSQTEYYYLRPYAKKSIIEVSLEKILNRKIEGIWLYDPKCLPNGKNLEAKPPKGSENWILIKKSACFFVFLIPAKWDESIKERAYSYLTNYDFERYNTWSINKVNPWKTVSYGELLKDCNVEDKVSTGDNRVLVDAYLIHLKKMTGVFEQELKGQFINYSPTTFGAYEYFKVLGFALSTREKKEKKNLFAEVIARPGSSNSGEPILDIYFSKEISISNEENIYSRKGSTSKEPELFSIGIQVQGQKVKLFIAANNYETLEILKEKKGAYNKRFLGAIGEAVLENGKYLLLSASKKQIPLQKALPNGKSFMDYYFPLQEYFGTTKGITFVQLFNLLYLLSEELSRSLVKKK